jgi:hypothetical protein
MVGAWIVLIDRLLHEAQPEHLRVEVHVPLGVRRDRSDVMETMDFGFHKVIV